MNDEGLPSLSFFSSERSSSLFSMAKVRKGDFGTRVPNVFDILLISNNLTNSQKSNWKMLKISKKSPQRPLEFWHMFWHTCARFLINLCQILHIRCLSKAFYKILQNSIGKYYIFCIGKQIPISIDRNIQESIAKVFIMSAFPFCPREERQTKLSFFVSFLYRYWTAHLKVLVTRDRGGGWTLQWYTMIYNDIRWYALYGTSIGEMKG